MSDILSQAEVDALLAAVSTTPESEPVAAGAGGGGVATGETMAAGAEPERHQKKVSLYDFKRPDRVSKDQMRTFQSLHENYARQLSTTLTNFLHTFVEVELVSVDQLTYGEFSMSISNSSCIYVFKMDPLEGSAIFEINPALVFFIIDRLFGGQGRLSEQNRELTQIERSVLNRIIDRGLLDLKAAWEHVCPFTPRIDAYETNPQFVQIAPPGETVILISLELRMQNASGLMSICFPYLGLESVMANLSREWMGALGAATPETRSAIEQEIRDINLNLSTVIGKTKLTLRDLVQLQSGDVLCLDKKVNSDLVIQIDGKNKMAGRSGLVGRRKAVRITRILEKEVPGFHE